MKIYTKKGDAGNTSLFGGNRVSKSTERIEAYGTVDELNSVVGFALSLSPGKRVKEILTNLQQQLFVLGADLATPLDTKTKVTRIGKNHVELLESYIDELDEKLPELKNFILPGGTQSGAVIHQARTVCRRAERATVACSKTASISENAVIYLNRLSDLLFVLARYENLQAGYPETPWKPEKNDKK